jgi:hypothetical protein
LFMAEHGAPSRVTLSQFDSVLIRIESANSLTWVAMPNHIAGLSRSG